MSTRFDRLTRFVELLAEFDPDAAALVSRPGTDRDRDATRALRTGLGELLAGREHRARAAAERAEATREAIRLRQIELTARGPALAQWPKRLHEVLIEVRLAVTADAAEAVRRLHDEARHEVENGDGDVRDGFPERLALAVGRLSHGVLARLDELLTELALTVGTVAVDVPVRTREALPSTRLPRPPPTAGTGGDRRLAGVLSLFGGLGVARLVWGYREVLPAVLGTLVPAIAVGLGVTACGLVARGRRASTRRALLTRWTAESLADLRGRLESEVARRVLAAERELGGCLERAVAIRRAELDAATRAPASPAERAGENGDLERLRAACAELDRLLGDPVSGATR